MKLNTFKAAIDAYSSGGERRGPKSLVEVADIFEKAFETALANQGVAQHVAELACGVTARSDDLVDASPSAEALHYLFLQLMELDGWDRAEHLWSTVPPLLVELRGELST